MKKAFTLAEALVTMAIIGIVMALSIPAVIQSTNDTRPLFKKAYYTVETVVNELINDTSLYPSGDLSDPASGSFCENFLSRLNTIGTISCTARAAITPDGTNQDATTTNAMKWYNLHSPSAFTPPGDNDTAFIAENCDGTGDADCGTECTGLDNSTDTCVRIDIDVNGSEKGADIESDQANRDIFRIYVTSTGKVTVQSPEDDVWDEAFILQN